MEQLGKVETEMIRGDPFAGHVRREGLANSSKGLGDSEVMTVEENGIEYST